MEILKDREQFVHRIEEAMCSASATHTANERTLEQSNLRLQYRQSLSAIVNSLTNHRITLEIIQVRSLQKSLMTNDSLYEHDILTAYSLGRIHHKIYRLNKSLIFLVIFPTPQPIIYRLYKPFVLPRLGERNDWKKNNVPHRRQFTCLSKQELYNSNIWLDKRIWNFYS